MKVTGVQVMIGVTLGVLALLGYCVDAANYYQPSSSAATEHASIRSVVDVELASVRSWSELDSIKHQVEVLELKIQRIIDLATLQERGLTIEEEQNITSLREEIRLHNDRKNALLAGQK